MTSDEICALYELTGADGEGHKAVYCIGTLSTGERIAVSSQQTRAINLMHALFETKRLEKGSRICVIGGGAAGVTAAAYAIHEEAEVTVLESRGLLWNLRGCRTRWLHPNLFRYWPYPEWKRSGTNFPVMNWYAGYANDVGDHLHRKFLAFEADQFARKGRSHLNLLGHSITKEIKIELIGDKWRVRWVTSEAVDKKPCRDIFDVLIIATGFGSEARARDTEAGTYWLDDNLEREQPSGRQVKYLISGTGDGGLTDLIRVRVNSFRHHHLREGLLNIDLYARELQREIKRIEAQEGTPGFDVTSAYKELAKEREVPELMDWRRNTTSVVLTNKSSGALDGTAWRVSKFLGAQFLQLDAQSTQYRKGPATWDAVLTPPINPKDPAPHPTKFNVTFDGVGSEEFDAVVVRHGPEKFRHAAWAGAQIPGTHAILTGLGFYPSVIQEAAKKWTGQNTDTVGDESWMNENRETRLRSRARAVLPAVSGRTVIGMLSRLISAVNPETHESPSPEGVEINDPLVADDVAFLLTEVSNRSPYGSKSNEVLLSGGADGSDSGWLLGSELSRADALSVIAAADLYLSNMWGGHPNDKELWERNWVLPRPPWSPSDVYLKHTCVARHWGGWQLRYERHGLVGAKPKTKRFNLRAKHLRRVASDLLPDSPHIMVILDDCAAQQRVAIVMDKTPPAWRLARELSAQFIYNANLKALSKLDS